MDLPFSNNKDRNKIYAEVLNHCQEKKITLKDIIGIGFKLMKKEKLHPHFFEDFNLRSNASALAYFALGSHTKSETDTINKEEARKILHLFERRIAERIPVEYITHEA